MKTSLRTSLLLGTFILIASNTSLATEIDINREITAALDRKYVSARAYVESETARRKPKGQWAALAAYIADKGAWRLSGVRLTPVETLVSEAKAAPIPQDIVRSSFVYNNCTTERLVGLDGSFSIAYQSGTVVTLNDSITKTSGQSVTIPVKAVEIGLNTSVQTGHSSTQQTQESLTKNESRTIKFDVPPRTTRVMTLERRVSRGFLTFEGIVSADGNVTVKAPKGSYRAGLLSELLDESARTFRLNGEIWNAKVENDVVTYLDKPIAANDSVCQDTLSTNRALPIDNDDGPLFQSAASVSAELARAAESTFVAAVRSENSAVPIASNLVTEPLVDGRTITTANVIANIEVRAKSFGPGFCATSVWSNTNRVNLLAPPLSWSDWRTIDTHIGSVSKAYSTRVDCDTGALFEIRYYK